MADYDWPAALAPHSMTFYLAHSTRVHESPFTRQRQTYALAPARWVARLSFAGGGGGVTINHGKGADIDALLAKLRGPQNRVTLFDWRRRDGRGTVQSHDDYAASVDRTRFTDGTRFTDTTMFEVTGNGEPTNSSAAAGDTQVALSGLAPSSTPRKAGDYIGFGDNRCYMIVEDATTDTEGRCVVTIEPPLRAAISADTVQFSDVRAIFRLVSDYAGNNPTDIHGLSTFEVDLVEDIT